MCHVTMRIWVCCMKTRCLRGLITSRRPREGMIWQRTVKTKTGCSCWVGSGGSSILKAFMMCRMRFMGAVMIRRDLAKFQFRAYGRWLGMTATSIPTSAILFPLTRRMYHRIFRAGHMYILFLTRRMGKRQKRF